MEAAEHESLHAKIEAALYAIGCEYDLALHLDRFNSGVGDSRSLTFRVTGASLLNPPLCTLIDLAKGTAPIGTRCFYDPEEDGEFFDVVIVAHLDAAYRIGFVGYSTYAVINLIPMDKMPLHLVLPSGATQSEVQLALLESLNF